MKMEYILEQDKIDSYRFSTTDDKELYVSLVFGHSYTLPCDQGVKLTVSNCPFKGSKLVKLKKYYTLFLVNAEVNHFCFPGSGEMSYVYFKWEPVNAA